MSVVVAVDGPAGSGKSSVSRAAAAALGYGFLDTGSAYRALAWRALDAGVEPGDVEAVSALLPGFAWRSALDPGERWVRVGETDVTDAVREPRVTAVVSAIARIPTVREALTAMFRERIVAAEHGVVVEGRDITTVVAPDADVRVLLTAAPEVRAHRRAQELPGADTHTVARAIAERDAKDAKVVDFLSAAPGVTELDSTYLDFDQTVDALVAIVRERTA
jgi:cytidylate kinase